MKITAFTAFALAALAALAGTCVEIKFNAFVLNRRVDLQAIDATLLDGVAMSVPHRSTEPARPRHSREMTS